MRLLGNIIWILLGGILLSIIWAILGLILCITVIGIPFGVQCFKMAKLTLAPFGKTVKPRLGKHPIINILWAIFFGWELALCSILAGIACCVTIIGIPFFVQWVKIAALSLIPFGATVS